MQLEQLEYFLTVARYEHVTRAAKACGISQPALSNAIARLENELGVELFDRSGRNIRLNHYGEVFRMHLEPAFEEIERAVHEVQELAGLETGTAVVGIDCPELVPELVCSFYQVHPQVHIRERYDSTSGLFEHLRSGQLDFLLCTEGCVTDDLEWYPLAIDRLAILVPDTHRLAGRTSVRVQDLTEEPLLCPRPGAGMRESIDLAMKEADVRPNIIFEGDNLAAVQQLAAAGIGIAIVSDLAEACPPAGLQRIPLEGGACTRTLGICLRQNHTLSRSAQLFLDYTKAYFLQRGRVFENADTRS